MRLRASRLPRCGSAAATTGSGGRTTTTAASARCMVSLETHSHSSASSRTLPSRARARLSSCGMRSARSASPTGQARRERSVRARDTGRICLQFCTRAPGVVAGFCHGTSGNGFALLKAFARTGNELWLERARPFAVHALAQAERIATANGHRGYSLFTGDVGTALFAAACLDADPRFPIVDVMNGPFACLSDRMRAEYAATTSSAVPRPVC